MSPRRCEPYDLVTTSMFDAVVDEHTAVLERTGLLELEVNLARHRVKRRDARSEQHGMDVEADAIDQSGFEQRSREFAAAHHDDVLAGLRLQARDEVGDVLTHDVDAVFVRQGA